ncbi:membrane-bound lytic murein transglycosylase D [Flavobacterium sp. 90]|uniref:lytic transglycosylase domain-containing protein n=1 Tax=unclassified Flavobacterium TaxID=196869 RepID=UPI000EB0A857|nr:membrane-bound lytic murein transglycosylase D [Flavobacterium sp. 81]TCK57066.1 membrane-bound lytic murein transglycosylase D [Flavobacterium sp. 90]
MKTKNTTLYFYILFLIPFFSQVIGQNKAINLKEKNNTYLDSVKKTFVRNNMSARVDSLWMKELTNLDAFNTLTTEIENGAVDQKIDLELPTELLKSRLTAMNAKSPFNIEYNPQLETVIKSFLKYRKKSFGRLMAASEYYFPLFEEALAKEKIPLEIKYLAVVESALNPKAVSNMGATGLWQFMYNTGKQYKLEIDSYVDERHDPLKSTEAAAKYMNSMYKAFGDWDLVLAAYNSGPGNVSKAINRSGGQKNYWNIRKNLPKETQGYIPAFLATMYLYEYHAEHGIQPEKALVKHFATDTIMIKKQMSFKQISDLIDIPIAQLELLNPSYKLNIVPVYDKQKHFLKLPQDKIAVFTSNEEKIYAYAEYQANLREKPSQNSMMIASKTTNPKKTATFEKAKYYVIQKGDTLGSIARKYSVSVSDLKKWNKINTELLALGKSLKITAK